MNKKDLLYRYLFDECSAGEKKYVENLLIKDKEYKALYDEIVASQEMLDGHFTVKAPEGIARSVMKEIRQPQQLPDFEFSSMSSSLLKRFGYLLAAAAVLWTLYTYRDTFGISLPDEVEGISSPDINFNFILIIITSALLLFGAERLWKYFSSRANMKSL